MMDSWDAEERPDFANAEYRESLELHRQSDFANFFENEFELLMDEGDYAEPQNTHDDTDLFASPMQLTLRPRSGDASMADNDDESNMDIDEAEPAKPKVPTSFLDLPRETRQAIIEYSHEEEPEKVVIKEWEEAWKYTDWANVLRQVHPVLVEDVNYVEERWNKRVVIMPWYLPKRETKTTLDQCAVAEAEEREMERLEKVRKRIIGKGDDGG
ncbi:hypothetical protein FKW77_009639 [Venturia effusa]|uniref:Uncharacterized protein n=1 Tax=Venturia effusa TaxID=50376 RepID=A0A517LEN7_9PEZI|nr:hypothetical protein FKW77_009639 [Venturia effusa]